MPFQFFSLDIGIIINCQFFLFISVFFFIPFTSKLKKNLITESIGFFPSFSLLVNSTKAWRKTVFLFFSQLSQCQAFLSFLWIPSGHNNIVINLTTINKRRNKGKVKNHSSFLMLYFLRNKHFVFIIVRVETLYRTVHSEQ